MTCCNHKGAKPGTAMPTQIRAMIERCGMHIPFRGKSHD